MKIAKAKTLAFVVHSALIRFFILELVTTNLFLTTIV